MTGSVGKYPIEMVLKTDGSTVSGYYRYTKSGSGAPINIKGTSHGSMVELEEYSNGKLCGTWRITLTQSGQSVSAMGEMINFKDQSFPVNLKGTKD